jgi:recombinational DNA repair protein RecT
MGASYQKKNQNKSYQPREKNPELYEKARDAVWQIVGGIPGKQFQGRYAQRKRGNVKLEVEREAALRAICKTKYAAEIALANPGSVALAMLDAAALGLTLHQTLGYAYLVPETFGDVPAISLVVGYKGLEQMALRSKTVLNIQTELVYSNDTYRRGMDREGNSWVEFEQARGERGELEGGFCRAILTNRTIHVEWMEAAEIDACESAADKKQGGEAKSWKGPFRIEFQKKSIVRRASKHWQLEGQFADDLKLLDQLEPMNFDRPPSKPAEETAVEMLTDAHKQAILVELDGYDLPQDQLTGWIERQCEAWGHPKGSATYADAGWEKLRDALKNRAENIKKLREGVA